MQFLFTLEYDLEYCIFKFFDNTNYYRNVKCHGTHIDNISQLKNSFLHSKVLVLNPISSNDLDFKNGS